MLAFYSLKSLDARSHLLFTHVFWGLTRPFQLKIWVLSSEGLCWFYFFEKRENEFWLWEFGFSDTHNYNSIFCKAKAKLRIV